VFSEFFRPPPILGGRARAQFGDRDWRMKVLVLEMLVIYWNSKVRAKDSCEEKIPSKTCGNDFGFGKVA
jgi:hypothetical protein